MSPSRQKPLVVQLRVTPAEKAELAARATRLGFASISALLRRLAFPTEHDASIDPPVRIPRPPATPPPLPEEAEHDAPSPRIRRV